jgi:hypothetical protein
VTYTCVVSKTRTGDDTREFGFFRLGVHVAVHGDAYVIPVCQP